MRPIRSNSEAFSVGLVTSFSRSDARRAVTVDPSTEQLSGRPATRSQSGKNSRVVFGRISSSRFTPVESISAIPDAMASRSRSRTVPLSGDHAGPDGNSVWS